MAAATLKFEKRETRGKNEARRLRASGRIPAVLYGAEKGKAFEIAVDPKALLKILHSESGVNTLIGLEGMSDAGRDTRVLVKEYQLDPIDHKLLHADFYKVAMDKMLTVTVPVVLKGEAKGVKQQGGIVDFVNREVEIEVLQAQPAGYTDPDHPAARTLGACAGGAPFELCPGVLDTRWYSQLGIPAFGYGGGRLEVAHGPNEYIDEAAMRRCAAVYAQFAAQVAR